MGAVVDAGRPGVLCSPHGLHRASTRSLQQRNALVLLRKLPRWLQQQRLRRREQCRHMHSLHKGQIANEIYRWVCHYVPLWAAMFVATGCMAAVYATVAADDNKKPEEDGGGEGGDLAGQNDYKGCLSMGIFWFMKKEEGATLSQDIRKRRVARQAR